MLASVRGARRPDLRAAVCPSSRPGVAEELNTSLGQPMSRLETPPLLANPLGNGQEQCNMQRIFGILIIVLAIWAGVEVYTRGMGGAFGGLFGSGLEAPATRSTPDRAADAFQRAYDKSEKRVDDALGRE